MELIKNHLPEIRFLYDLKDVLYDQNWLKTAPNLKVYYMYRDLAADEKEHQQIKDYGLRYDITIIDGHLLGSEFPKTLGHDHPVVPGTSITYPELYEVLEGEAIFLLQDSKNDEIKDVFAIKAKKGDKVLILPNYEHLIINPSNKELKTCNWTCRNFASNIYKPFRARQGFSYYAIKDPSQPLGTSWIKNENYESIPELKFEEPNNFYEFELEKDKPIYNLINNLEKINFLIEPQKYEW